MLSCILYEQERKNFLEMLHHSLCYQFFQNMKVWVNESVFFFFFESYAGVYSALVVDICIIVYNK